MTALMRCAEACFSASMVMSNSMMPSETGEHEGCTTNTSASRTFSSIWTNMFSFEKRMTLERPSGKPICEQIALASSGCAEPLKILMSRYTDPPPPCGHHRVAHRALASCRALASNPSVQQPEQNCRKTSALCKKLAPSPAYIFIYYFCLGSNDQIERNQAESVFVLSPDG